MATTATEIASEPEMMEVGADPEFPPHRMTVDRYERLVEAGVYGAKDPVFLWRGRLVEKMSKGRPHVIAAIILFRLFDRLMPEGYHVEQEAPLAIGDDSMPEPDLAVIRGSLRDYLKRAPTAKQALLVVEVADSSVALDSRTKLKAYAAEAIPVYWIVNIPKSRISVYSQPTGPTETPSYGDHREYGPDDEVPVVLDGHELGRVSAKEILP